MNLLRSAFLFALAAVAVPNGVHAGSIGNAAAQSSCDAAVKYLGIEKSTTCKCMGDYKPRTGLTASVVCKSVGPLCLSNPKLLCGVSTTSLKLKAQTIHGSPIISSNVTSCFSLESGFPKNLTLTDPSVPLLCVTARPMLNQGLTLSNSCEVSLGGQVCQSCTFCKNKVTFSANCSNVDIGLGIPVPAGHTCLDFSYTGHGIVY